MKTSKQLKEERASLITEQDSLVQTAKTENRSLAEAEATTFDDLQARIDAFEPQIKRAEQIEANEKRAAAAAGQVVGKSEEKEKREMIKAYSLHKALRSQLPNGKLDGVEAEYDQEMRNNLPKGVNIQGVAVPNGVNQKRAAGQTVSQDSGAYGANLVVDQYAGIIEALNPNPVVAGLGARYLRGLTGDAVFPTNGGGITATWETEIATVSATKNAYGRKTMTPKRLSATVVVSLQNMLQSTPDLEMITANDIRGAVERAIDSAVINGPGSGGAPEGILNNSSVDVLAGDTNGIAPSWAQLVAMETAVFAANAAGGNLNYLITPGLKGLLKTTAHTANNAYYLMGTDNTINGYNATASTLVPSNLTKGTGTDLHAAIFGDFANVFIGEWGVTDMVVDNITQKKSGNIEVTVNKFLDILLRHPEAFSVSKDFIV